MGRILDIVIWFKIISYLIGSGVQNKSVVNINPIIYFKGKFYTNNYDQN